MYQLYQAQSDMLAPMRAMARLSSAMLGGPFAYMFGSYFGRNVAAGCELLSRTALTHVRPPFGFDSVHIRGREVAVCEERAHVAPFATLLHFKKDLATAQPRVLLVAPMSGHFSTLLRETARTLLAENDVYITDWHNARDVPADAGRFDFDDYIAYLIRFLEILGPGAHVVAVCQPSPAALAAVALMAQTNHPAQASSLTLMAGPVDARQNPTKVNELSTEHSMEWFEALISRVPYGHRGATRRVYPGFLQLGGFLSMNFERHVKAHQDLYDRIVARDDAKADAVRAFYDEYFAVQDLPAEYFLQTIQKVFQNYALARGVLEWRGSRVEPAGIERTALLTVEGERDDICGIGQTLAAHDLCRSLRPSQKRHHFQAGVGHYGVFSGKRWHNEIYPVLQEHIFASDAS